MWFEFNLEGSAFIIKSPPHTHTCSFRVWDCTGPSKVYSSIYTIVIAEEGISCQLMTGWKGQKSKSRRRGLFIKCHGGTKALLSGGGEEKVKPHSAFWRAQSSVASAPCGSGLRGMGNGAAFQDRNQRTGPRVAKSSLGWVGHFVFGDNPVEKGQIRGGPQTGPRIHNCGEMLNSQVLELPWKPVRSHDWLS